MEVILYGGFLCSALRLVSLLLLWLSVLFKLLRCFPQLLHGFDLGMAALFKLLLLGWLHLDIRQPRKPYTN